VDPQLEGWPPTAEERAYVVKRVEHDRRPGRESLKHLPKWLFGEMAIWGLFGAIHLSFWRLNCFSI
jgi:hypothetical protein